MISDDIKRLNFYEKQFLGARDFRDEQSYHIEMRRRHLIAHHSWGLVAGLEISEDANSQVWSLQPGIAVDGYGREILVFDPEPLNVESIADQLAGLPKPAFLKIWIAYKLEKSNKPASGFEVCGLADQFMRVRETFRLFYQNDPPFDLRPNADPSDKNPDSENNWPVAFQDLPDDPGSARWPVYLGTLTWDTDPNNPAQNLITSFAVVDPNDNQRRRYVGVIAAEIEAPDNKLLIRGRGNPSPLPANPADPKYNGVPVKIAGTLEIERQVTAGTDLNVLGKVGIGIGSAAADTKLQVDGGTDATLANGSGYAVIGKVTAKNIVMDDHGVMARNNGANSELDLQIEGGDLVVHKNKAGSEVVVKDSGQVGMGTTAPAGRLTLNGILQPQQGLLTFFSSNADMEYNGGNDQTFVFSNTAANGKTVFMGGDFGIDRVPAVKLDVADGGVFIRHPTGDGIGGRALEIGSQSPATNAVPNGRIGFPGHTIQHGQIRWVPGGGASGRFEFIDSSNSSPSGDYGVAPTFVNTRAKDGIFTGRLGVGTTNPVTTLDVNGDIRGTTVRGGSWSHKENINFVASVFTSSLAWVEIGTYTRSIPTPDLANLIVTLHIPFVGNSAVDSRSRIRLEFDGTPISDSTKYNEAQWELHEITLTGLVKNVNAGSHSLKVFAMVDKGVLHIPHYNPARIEDSGPAIFANLFLVGFY